INSTTGYSHNYRPRTDIFPFNGRKLPEQRRTNSKPRTNNGYEYSERRPASAPFAFPHRIKWILALIGNMQHPTCICNNGSLAARDLID
ncbi:MAG: hypothetical protein V8Q38_03795, partial [Alistipes putredinis]